MQTRHVPPPVLKGPKVEDFQRYEIRLGKWQTILVVIPPSQRAAAAHYALLESENKEVVDMAESIEDEACAVLAAWREAPGAGKDPAEAKKRIKELKMRTKCRACDGVGHWHRDPECPRRKGKVTATRTTSSRTTWAQARQTVKDWKTARGYRPVRSTTPRPKKVEDGFLVEEDDDEDAVAYAIKDEKIHPKDFEDAEEAPEQIHDSLG